MSRSKSQKHNLHVFQTASPKLRRSLVLTADEFIKALVECGLNALNGSHKVSAKVKTHLCKDENCLAVIVSHKLGNILFGT
jgi:hypothetical protein